MKTAIVIITCFAIMIHLSSGCNPKRGNKKEGFYDYSQTWDLYRIPLIEPYEVISADKGFTWFFQNKNGQIEVNSIGIKESLIICYSRRVAVRGNMSQAWFVTETTTGDQTVFTTEREYGDFLQKLGVSRIEIYNNNTVFKEFAQEGRLPPEWPKQPSNKK